MRSSCSALLCHPFSTLASRPRRCRRLERASRWCTDISIAWLGRGVDARAFVLLVCTHSLIVLAVGRISGTGSSQLRINKLASYGGRIEGTGQRDREGGESQPHTQHSSSCGRK